MLLENIKKQRLTNAFKRYGKISIMIWIIKIMLLSGVEKMSHRIDLVTNDVIAIIKP